MSDIASTTCPHNANGQTIRADYPVPCRQCGAMIQASKAAGMVPSEGPSALDETYPGDAANQTADLSL